MMQIHSGDILVAHSGEYYRVVECRDNIVSLQRVQGYTLFSCSLRFVQATFSLQFPVAVCP